MAPQRWKVPISIFAVIRIDHTDWLDIMVDDLNHLSPHVLIFLRNPILLISQCMEMNRWLSFRYTSFTYLNRPIWIDIIMKPHSCIKHTNKTTSLIHRYFTILKEQQLFFIWNLYEEAKIFKLLICLYKNNHLIISAHW